MSLSEEKCDDIRRKEKQKTEIKHNFVANTLILFS